MYVNMKEVQILCIKQDINILDKIKGQIFHAKTFIYEQSAAQVQQHRFVSFSDQLL